jgi:hypothetical protein
MPAYVPGGNTGGTGGAGGGLDPATLHVVIGNSGATCAEPREIVHCAEWAVRIPLPPELQQVGTIPLSRVYGLLSVGGEVRSGDPSDCGIGMGSFGDGFLDIQSIDDTRIAFSLSDTWAFDVDVNGSYTAERCAADE